MEIVKIVSNKKVPKTIKKIKQSNPILISNLNLNLSTTKSNNLVIINKGNFSNNTSKVIPVSNNKHKSYKYIMTKDEKELFKQLTTLYPELPNVGSFKEGEIFIHWYYPERKKDELSACEIFHINMLRYFGIPNGMTTIHIRCACNCEEMTKAMKQAVEMLSEKATVDFKVVPNKDTWERDTIKEAVDYALTSEKFIYYTHFKGTSRITPHSDRNKICSHIDILYWNYLMYRGLFTEQSELPAIGPIAYCEINKNYVTDMIHPKHQYIGSFQAFDGKVLKERLQEIGLETEEKRNKYIWNVSNGKYAVEMFLCIVFKEQQVHCIAQLPKGRYAYGMYQNKFCPNIIEEFCNPYQPKLGKIFNKKKNIAICCVAKNEDLYAEEWIEHHRKLGVSHFYWYDNNDTLTDTIKKISTYKDVTVIPLNGKEALKKINYQRGAYQTVYDKYGKNYGWIGFLDLDEFVDIDDNKTLPELLNQPMFDGTTSVSMHWRYYNDNGLARYDDRPLQERFKNPAPIDVRYSNSNPENCWVKSFIRTELPLRCEVHNHRYYGSLNRQANGNIREPYADVDDIDVSVARVKHFGSKTIEEFIKRKCFNTSRASGLSDVDAKTRLDWFFNANEVTPEKLEVINELLPNLKYNRE